MVLWLSFQWSCGSPSNGLVALLPMVLWLYGSVTTQVLLLTIYTTVSKD